MSTDEQDVDYDEEVEEQETAPAASAAAAPAPASGSAVKAKGRGHNQRGREEDSQRGGHYESVDEGAGAGPAKSVEGWIVLVTGVHEEAQEDDLHEHFADYGEIRNMHLNLDRRTGFVKGYALIEYETKKEAQAAIDAANGSAMLDQTLEVSFAFSKGPLNK